MATSTHTGTRSRDPSSVFGDAWDLAGFLEAWNRDLLLADGRRDKPRWTAMAMSIRSHILEGFGLQVEMRQGYNYANKLPLYYLRPGDDNGSGSKGKAASLTDLGH